MEHVSGVALNDIWSQMSEVQHIEFIECMGKLAKELCALDFRALGSLYLNTADKPPGAHAVDEEYCIGPHCGRQFWVTMTTRQLKPRFLWVSKAPLLRTSRKTLEVVGDTTTFQDACSPLLFHPDLHARNIIVDLNHPTQILGIIDWQSAAVEPAFVHAVETPDFAEEQLLDKTLDADVSRDSLEAEHHSQRCKRTWAVMAFLCPKLGKATTLNPALCRYLAGVSSGCSDEATSLRSLLIDVSSEWKELGIPGVCPYQPSQADAKLLSVELDQLESTQRLRAYLSRLLRREMDGWIEEGRWHEVVPIYREQYAEFVSACVASREEDETAEDAEKKADKLWPFDLR
ncbi:hypothetical protein LTR81_027610 [Elasticomyces elasticus]